MENYLAAGCSELVKQSPCDEFTILSLSRSDPKFQAICRDFGEAVTAFRSFQAQGERGQARAAEFRQICEDLRIELMEYVDQSTARPKAQGRQ
ncbi:hypothetical protein [Ruegeria arenilitoris]|uniref:hypothetical protein n=1 Tax=Ruegeria arenilitoris TaxID=1173585 RepID=UPI00147AE0B0|nr:hypothetical protein [Ruegeria arenilitoris]